MTDLEAHDTLIRIDGNVQALLKGKDDHETRIRGLERSKWLGFAALGVIGLKLGLPWFTALG